MKVKCKCNYCNKVVTVIQDKSIEKNIKLVINVMGIRNDKMIVCSNCLKTKEARIWLSNEIMKLMEEL